MKPQTILAFALGAVTGTIGTMLVLKKKYEEAVNEELEALKIHYDRKVKEQVKAAADDIKAHIYDYAEFDNDTDNYNSDDESEVIEGPGYKEYVKKYGGDPDNAVTFYEEENCADAKPFLITPEEFGEKEGYSIEYMTYYNDGILTDNAEDVVEDIDGVVGYSNLDHFGDYEKDIIHVRNPRLKMDYEVSKDTMTYQEVYGSMS